MLYSSAPTCEAALAARAVGVPVQGVGVLMCARVCVCVCVHGCESVHCDIVIADGCGRLGRRSRIGSPSSARVNQIERCGACDVVLCLCANRIECYMRWSCLYQRVDKRMAAQAATFVRNRSIKQHDALLCSSAPAGEAVLAVVCAYMLGWG